MLPISYQTIYDSLQPDWWFDTFPTDANTPWATCNVYFKDNVGTYNYCSSSGVGSSLDSQTLDALRSDVARYLIVGHCTGGITNVRPAAFQPQPIFYK